MISTSVKKGTCSVTARHEDQDHGSRIIRRAKGKAEARVKPQILSRPLHCIGSWKDRRSSTVVRSGASFARHDLELELSGFEF